MQPRFVQVPPHLSFSMTRAFAPSRAAPRAAACPPGPEPITTRSYISCLRKWFPVNITVKTVFLSIYAILRIMRDFSLDRQWFLLFYLSVPAGGANERDR